MKDNYVQATLVLLKDHPVDTVLASLKKIMSGKGHEGLYGSVLKEVVTTLEQKDAVLADKINIAKASDKDSVVVQKLCTELGVTVSEATITIDEKLIGGAVVSKAGKRIDASYKTFLLNLYQSITK